jgi:hypothetical protein
VLYGLLLLTLLMIQDVLMSKVSIFGATTDLLPCGILLICIVVGGEAGSIFALTASALYVFSGSGPGYYTIALLTILGVIATVFRQAYLHQSFSAVCLCAGTALLAYELVTFFINLFLGITLLRRLPVFVLTWLMTLCVIPMIYPIIQSISKIGGEAWKE